MPPTNVRQVLKKRLHMKPYKLQLFQVPSDNDNEAFSTFCVYFLGMTLDDENLMLKVVFCDEMTFHVSGKINTHNCHTLTLQNPRASAELQRDSLKVNVFCASSEQKVCKPSYLLSTITGTIYLDILQK
jgi:hypothetical protein